MKTKVTQRAIAMALIIALITSIAITVNLFDFGNIALATENTEFMNIPQITVFTHGLSSRASYWSNPNGSGADVFAEDQDSLVYKLSEKAGGADIYRAETKEGDIGSPDYTLYSGYGDIEVDIDDISKHIIIVFDSQSSEESNDVVYAEFKNMLLDVINRVASLNPGNKKPKVNLIGHSRGGITNLQFALDYPEYVDSMISIGTPYFGSPLAEFAAPILFDVSEGLTDICDETVYNEYYERWNTGYESKYKEINSIAIGATTTIKYQCDVLEAVGGELSGELSSIISCYNLFLKEFTLALAPNAYDLLLLDYPALRNLSKQEFVSIAAILYLEINLNTWYSDVFVPVYSQQGVNSDKNYHFTKYVKEYNNDNGSLSPKRAVNNLPIIHNLETYDADIHNYILNNIVVKSGDAIATEISNVGKVDLINNPSGHIYYWEIKIRNIHNEERIYSYNSNMCFLGDAQNWTGLSNIVTFRLGAGETKIVNIYPNGTATSIAVSSVKENTRYIKYANNLYNDYYLYKMTTYSNTKPYYDYPANGMTVSIVGKNGNKWLVDLTNNTGKSRTFYYNSRMCYAGDAQNWLNLSDVRSIYLANGATTPEPLEITENLTATSIAISYTEGIQRFIFYAYDLNVSGTMSAFANTKPQIYEAYGMSVAITGKEGNTWKIYLRNDTGKERTFEYNAKMCFAGDAEAWNLSADVNRVTLGPGGNCTLSISENGTATSIAISYVDDNNYRKIFYAYDLKKNEATMTEKEASFDVSSPPDTCIAEGTLITLADGTQVPVEELTGDEMLLVWNMETGTFDAAPIMFIDSDPIGHYEVIALEFSNGTTVDVISEHAFWDFDLNRYVYLDENAEEYIGHKFAKQSANGYTEVTLTDVEISTEVTTAYSPVTYGHLCYYVNGMLSMPGGITGFINIFDVDPETLTIDEEAKAADIEEYGLFTYEEFYEIFPVTEEVFEAFNGQYLKISVGKGLITYEQIGALIERYSEFF